MDDLSHFLGPRGFVVSILCISLTYKFTLYCLGAYRRSQYARKHGCKPPPSYPLIDPILGLDSLYRTIRAIRRGHSMDELEDRFRRVNGGVTTYSSVLLGSKNVHTMDPENVKTMLRTNWKDYGHSPSRKASFGYLGKGILVTDGPEWEVSRSMLRPSFKMSQIRNLPALEEHVANLIKQIKKGGEVVDLQPLFLSFTLDTIFETLMGEKLNSLLGSSDDIVLAELPDAVDYFSERAALRQRLGPLANLILGRKFWNALALANKFVSERVAQALASRPGAPSAKVDQGQDQDQDHEGRPNENTRYVFLHEIVKRHDDAERIRGELMHVLGAGRNTTASVLSVLCYTVARHPNVLQKLRQEIQQQVGPDPPTYENLRSLNYLKWTINETSRLYPVAPYGTRVALVDTVLPTGGGKDGKFPILIKAGTSVWWAGYAMHRRETFWGKDALEFKPERWESLGDPGWNYVPFGGGPHLCPGQQFALTEIAYTMVRLLQTFCDMKPGDDSVWAEKIGLVVSVRSGCKVILTNA